MRRRYHETYRRTLLDMHIPDWDPAFLAQYDVSRVVEAYERGRISGVMLYCQSHVGLCYWPTRVAQMHRTIEGHDIVAEQLALLDARGIPACAYYSCNYNNWAWERHPDWRIVPAGTRPALSFLGSRYGTCCPNNPGYRDFVLEQAREITAYDTFDGIFFDDVFWPTVCVCPHCRVRYQREEAREFPLVVDWCDPDWCRFQISRERWLGEYARRLVEVVKALRPEWTVHHNFGVALGGWPLGVPLESAMDQDFLGADLYGDSADQLMATKLMYGLSRHAPPEFMTCLTTGVREHVQLKSEDELRLHALAATAMSSTFLAIDWINPDGTVKPGGYDRLGKAMAEVEPYEPYLGGEPLADVAVYFSGDSRMAFRDNGRLLADIDSWAPEYPMPHLFAAREVCRKLQEGHLPFDVVTRVHLDRLAKYQVLILPDVHRMDDAEVDAVRRYVEAGGNLYASRYTSLTHSLHGRQPDFLLADIFGCRFEADDLGAVSYLRPQTDAVRAAIAPQEHLTLATELIMFGPAKDMTLVKPLRLSPDAQGEVLATLTLPYGGTQTGTILDRQWSSIHSSPPWHDTPHPVLVRSRFGKGTAVYSAANLESLPGATATAAFLALLRGLLREPLAYGVDAHRQLWMHGFHQPQHQRLILTFLNAQRELPPVPLGPCAFYVRPPEGTQIHALRLVPDGQPLTFTMADDGTVHAVLERIEWFAMVEGVM